MKSAMMPESPFHRAVTSDGDDVTIAIKVVPSASRDRIAGMLGNRLKITLTAPAEGGKANRAIRTLFAALLHIPANRIEVTAGAKRPEKTLRITSITRRQVLAHLPDDG